VFVIGLQMTLTTHNVLIPMASILIGGIVGELLGIQTGLDSVGKALEQRFARDGETGKFARGFVTGSLVFCIGPLAILGAIQDGLIGDYSLLTVKSILDAFAGLAFASTLGIGVAFASLPLLVYQGGISLAARGLGTALGAVSRDTPWVIEMSAAGGVLIMGISFLLLNLKQVRVANLLPAVVIAPLIVVALAALGIRL
jgi:uncharacterized membrane protein YqgA involved in biofilm formation